MDGMSPGRRKGFALITVFLFATILALMVGALLLVLRQDRFRTMGYSDEVAAVYVAEVGVADVLDRLMDDLAFDTDLINVPVPNQRGSYTVTWRQPSFAGPKDSVNNLAGAATVDGPRGSNSLPPRAAEIVVEARVGAVSRTTQLIVLAPPPPTDGSPMAATGNIYLRGNIKVDSVDGLIAGYISGGKTVHSNSRPGTVQWTKEVASDKADFDGDVSCSCSQSTAVNLQGTQGNDYFLDSQQSAVPSINVSAIDVGRAVADQNSYPAPTLNMSGVTVLPAGNYYFGGNITLPDNLVLEDGANLFVRGNLDVDGTVTGNGKVMVDGTVDMYGDLFATGNDSHFVSMMASGDVNVNGFNGDDRISALAAADPTLATNLGQLDSLLNNYQSAITANDTANAQTARAALGKGVGGQLFEQIKASIDADPNNDRTKQFLQQKMDKLSNFFGDYEVATGSTSIGTDTLDGSNTDGLADFALRRNDSDLQNISRTLAGQINAKELGYSHFRGVLYSGGTLRVQNGVSILGGALANDGTGGGTFANFVVPVDPSTYEPTGRISGSRGVIDMRGGTRLTIDRALLSGAGTGGGGGLRIASWIKR